MGTVGTLGCLQLLHPTPTALKTGICELRDAARWDEGIALAGGSHRWEGNRVTNDRIHNAVREILFWGSVSVLCVQTANSLFHMKPL